MLMYGTHLLSTTEELQPISIEEIYKKIKTPNDDVLNTITRLRTLRTISKTRYVQMKKELPFFVCSIFSPKFRRTENFAYTEYFVVDIDNLSEKKLEPEDIKQTLIKDKRVNMCFTSPSCDGIKLLFKLNDRCYDAGIYAMFYRSFIHQLSEQYNLDQVVDTKTCDVTRACFLSHDPSAYLQNDPKYIKISDYLNLDNINDMFTQDHILIDATKKEKQEISQSKSEEILDPDKETLLHIKGILGQKKALMMQKKPPVYIPEILNEVIEDVKSVIEESGIKVINITDIQYGKKIHTSLGTKTSEINLFYGKKGFSVVQTPKRGCSKELNEIVAEILKCYFLIY